MKKLICSLCEQVVRKIIMSSQNLSKDHFVKVIKLVRKTFSFCNFCEIYALKK